MRGVGVGREGGSRERVRGVGVGRDGGNRERVRGRVGVGR